MDTVLKPTEEAKKPLMSFSQKLFISVISLFLIFAGCFIAYQFQREKEYKVELLNTKLQDLNERLERELQIAGDSAWTEALDYYLHTYVNRDLRVTVIDHAGKVLYDSYSKKAQTLDNHIGRPEIQKALKQGTGYDVRRTSETTGMPYFYSATLYNGHIIRSALPYDVNLMNNLAADRHYLWFTLFVSLILVVVFYKFTSKLGMAISHLREFARRADRNLPIEIDTQTAFPHNELGDISQHIIQIYRRLRQTKEALYIEQEEQVRLKRQLTHNIAHELKTPVSSIQGYLETIVNNPTLPPEKMKMFLERCYAQSNRLSRLLRDISVLTRMDEAPQLIDMEQVNLSRLISNIVNEVALELEEKRINVVQAVREGIEIHGNYSLLYSIFRNLMDNAIAYAGTDIEVKIACYKEDNNFYYFSFEDSGIGVSPEHLARLFERFYRVDKGRSRKLGGTGLGLAIVKNAVLIHGGSIAAQNSPEGGMKFVFTLAK